MLKTNYSDELRYVLDWNGVNYKIENNKIIVNIPSYDLSYYLYLAKKIKKGEVFYE